MEDLQKNKDLAIEFACEQILIPTNTLNERRYGSIVCVYGPINLIHQHENQVKHYVPPGLFFTKGDQTTGTNACVYNWRVRDNNIAANI